MVGDDDGDGRADPGAFDSSTRTWTTTVQDGSGPSRSVRVDQQVVIGNSAPAPMIGIAWLNGEQARLASIRSH